MKVQLTNIAGKVRTVFLCYGTSQFSLSPFTNKEQLVTFLTTSQKKDQAVWEAKHVFLTMSLIAVVRQ